MTWAQGVERFSFFCQLTLLENSHYIVALFNKVLELLRLAPSPPRTVKMMLRRVYARFCPTEMRDHLINVDADVSPAYNYSPIFDEAALLI